MEKEALKELLVDLQSCGLRYTTAGGLGRQGGAGPANGSALDFGDYQAVIATTGKCIEKSPYSMEMKDKKTILKKDGRIIGNVGISHRPRFYDLQTKDGVPYWKIALVHGKDCLASTVFQACCRWNTPDQCQFCSIGTSLDEQQTILCKTPEQLAETAEAAVRLDGIRHMTLTAGSTLHPEDGIRYLAKCAVSIRNRVPQLPIHVQFEPYDGMDDGVFQKLKVAGVETVGIHIESFDQSVRERITPGKAKISVETYFTAFEKAVRVFGRNQVSTFVIVGLGENPAVLVEGCRKAAALGVYPFIVPFKPVVGSPMGGMELPVKASMLKIYKEVSDILWEYGLEAKKNKAGCVRCGACSALPAFERCL